MNMVEKPKTGRTLALAAGAVLCFSATAFLMCPVKQLASYIPVKQASPNVDRQPSNTIAQFPAARKEFERGKMKADEKVDPLLTQLAEAIPYESLDCSMLPVERTEESEYLSKEFIRLFNSVGSKVSASINETNTLMRLAIKYNCLYEESVSCLDDPLMTEIAKLRYSNSPQRMVAVVNYLDSLGIRSGNEDETLYGEYLALLSEAEFGLSSEYPDITCLQHQAYAYQLSILADTVLAQMLIDNPSMLGEALGSLPHHHRKAIVLQCATMIGHDFREIEDFYYSLPEQSQGIFLERLADMILFSYSNDEINTANELAVDTSDPHLKEAVIDPLQIRRGLIPKKEDTAASEDAAPR